MITLRKLSGLKPGTRHRKLASLLLRFETEIGAGRSVDSTYIRDLFDLACSDSGLPSGTRDTFLSCRRTLAWEPAGIGVDTLRRACNRARHALLRHLGAEPAEWDLLPRSDSAGDAAGADPRTPGDREVVSPRAKVYLDDIRSPFNVGAVVRTAAAYGVEELLLSPDTPPPDHPRARRASMGSVDLLRWRRIDASVLSEEKAVFALEHGGVPTEKFHFPEQGLVILGNEELGVSPALLDLADRSAGRVTIATPGPRRSLNVSVAFGILIHHWQISLREQHSPVLR